MNRVVVMVMGFVLVVLVLSLAMAVHYRHQSEYYQGQWKDALTRLAAEPVSTAPTTMRTEANQVIYVKTPAATEAEEPILRERLVTLENQLAEKESQLRALMQAATPHTEKASLPTVDRTMSATWRGTNAVARRTEFEKRRQEAQQTVQSAFAKKAAFLLNRDTSKLSEDEKKDYDHMVGLLDETWKLAAQLQQPNLPGADRRDTMHTLRENVKALDPLLSSERIRQFRDLGTSLGYSGPEAENFINYITAVIEVTDASSITPHFHGGGWWGSVGRQPKHNPGSFWTLESLTSLKPSPVED